MLPGAFSTSLKDQGMTGSEALAALLACADLPSAQAAQVGNDGPPPSDEWLAEADRAERCRIAQVAAIVALQEVQATAGVGAGAEAG